MQKFLAFIAVVIIGLKMDRGSQITETSQPEPIEVSMQIPSNKAIAELKNPKRKKQKKIKHHRNKIGQ